MASRPDTFMPLMVGDYLKDTGHLTTEQHGAYLLLLMAYWARGGALVADDARLAATARLTPQQWARHKGVLSEFFIERDGQWINKRSEEEIALAKTKMEAKAKAGATAANARWQKDTVRNATAMRTHSDRNAKPITEPCPSSSPSHSVSEVETEGVVVVDDPPPRFALVGKPLPTKGSRWPDGQKIPEEWLECAKEKRIEHKLPPIDLRLEAEKFANYWASKPGKDGVKTNWKSTWINWILKEKGREHGHKSTSDGGGGTFQDAFERLALRVSRAAAE